MNYDQEPYFKNFVNTFSAPFLFSDTYMPKGSECGRFPQRRARCCTELFDLPVVVFSTPKETKKLQKKRGRGVSIASATIGVAVGFPTKVKEPKQPPKSISIKTTRVCLSGRHMNGRNGTAGCRESASQSFAHY